MKTNFYYFDGVLHLSIEKSKNKIKILKSLKNDYKNLTPNQKIISKIKEDNRNNFQIILILDRIDKKYIKLVKKFLIRKDVNLTFIKDNNIFLKKEIKFTKLDINSIYDSNIENLENIKDISNAKDLFLVNPLDLSITNILKKDLRDDYSSSSDSDIPEDNKYLEVPIKYSIFELDNSYYSNINNKSNSYNLNKISLNKNFNNIGYDFDGVLHISVTKPDPNGQIHPLPNFRHMPNYLQPNQKIINQIKSQFQQGNKIFIITARQSINSLNTINTFLSRKDVNLNSIINYNDIILSKGNKGITLAQKNINTFYDDSINILNDIKKFNPNIRLFLVNPYNLSINPFNNFIHNNVFQNKDTIYKNVAIILFSGKNLDRIVMVRDRFTKEWMIPGGNIDRTDKSPFFTAAREFYEETSFKLPNLNNVKKYDYNAHTLIYKGYTKNIFGIFRPTNETDQIAYPKLSSILNGSFGPIKRNNINSFYQMYKNKFIP